jgi:surfactin synthase thioesterase subunit
MEVRLEGKQGTVVSGIDPVLAEIQQRLQAQPRAWLQTLAQNPGSLANLEQEIHRSFAQMADRVVAGLLAQATADAAFADTAQKK